MSRNDSWCVTVAAQDGIERCIGWESSRLLLHSSYNNWWTRAWDVYGEQLKLVEFRYGK